MDSAVLGLVRRELLAAGIVLVLGRTFTAPPPLLLLGLKTLVWLKPGHVCGVISVVAEFMVDVGVVETRPCVRSDPRGCPLAYRLAL
jgi:hypothetical protein